MGSPIWRVNRSRAEFLCGRFSAIADLERPFDGWNCIEPSFSSAEVLRIFQIRLPDAAEHGLAVADAYVRVGDLIVTYDQSEARPFSVQICWRGLAGDADARIRAGIEVVASVNTSLLDSRPVITSRSELPICEMLRLQSAGTSGFERLEAEQQDCVPDSGKGCFVFRLPKGAASYVEMIHPLDFEQSTIMAPADPLRRTIEHSLISRWMEKGVIVRSRMRGLFVDRRDDLATAAAAYTEFCRSQLPLST